MPTYERVEDSEVVERVNLIEGSYEATRIGVLAIEGRNGWRQPPRPLPARLPEPEESVVKAKEPDMPVEAPPADPKTLVRKGKAASED